MTETTIEASGRKVTISNADKVLFPDNGFTKTDMARYYARIWDAAAAHYRERPLSMQRFPDGIGAEGFFQKNASDHFPRWIERVEMKKEGGNVHYVVVSSAATLVYLADQGMISPHLGLARNDKPDHPDRMVFDLDPPGEDFELVQFAAKQFRRYFDKIDVPCFVQTTGSRGMHVVVPLDRSANFDQVRKIARQIADELAGKFTDRLTIEQRKEQRGNRLFLDTARNAYGQTAIAPFGVRALPGAPVATPLDWGEALSSSMGPRRCTVENMARRLAQKVDPWTDMAAKAISARQLEKQLSPH